MTLLTPLTPQMLTLLPHWYDSWYGIKNVKVTRSQKALNFKTCSPIRRTHRHGDITSILFVRKQDYLKKVAPTFTFANWTATVISTQPMHARLVAVHQWATLFAFANFTAHFVQPESMRAILLTAHECRTGSWANMQCQTLTQLVSMAVLQIAIWTLQHTFLWNQSQKRQVLNTSHIIPLTYDKEKCSI
jgi:hypothetical protein